MRECADGRHRDGVPIAPLRKVHTSERILLLTDFPARFLRSPDCPIWGSLCAINQTQYLPDAAMNSPIMLGQTETLLIRGPRRII